MNPLVYEDLFFCVCDCLTFEQILKYELVSKYHLKIIRQHPWHHPLKINENDLLLILIKRYTLKNLNLSDSDVTDESVKRLKCHTLKLSSTAVTDESVKHLQCHDLDLSWTKVT